ncbi:MAG: beta-ketoacyl synthase N-terminal-like domain-containing protein [Myxococcota bacterium]
MFEPIAIVGQSCILPGASSPRALWDAVVEGRDLVSSVPAGRWGLPPSLSMTDDPDHSADRAFSDRGGYVQGFDFEQVVQRDPFRRDASDLLRLDPLFHWVLHGGREALRQAGHQGTSDRVAAIMGNLSFPSRAMSQFAEHVWFNRPAVDPRNRFMSGLPALLLADELGLGGPAFALDAACASSLYAVKLACDQLHDRSVDLALAGAVCRSDDLFIHVGFCALGAMSRTGQSRPFHANADGLVPAEGAAFFALKRLADAEAANDRILGVIRGIGLSNDGRGRGLLAPDSKGQSRALHNAWAQSGVDPARLSMVECHATGTTVGDATEIRTLANVFGNHEDLPLGSLKSNLGHLITAAGAAGMMKVLGAFEAGIRPPTLHVDTPNPALADTPFRLLTQAEPWISDGPRVAAVNAFGFGGNNAHVILEEYEPQRTPHFPAAALPNEPIAVVGIGVRAPGVSDVQALAEELVRPTVTPQGPPPRSVVDEIVLSLSELKFPPRDLQQTLAQQLLVLDAAMQATRGATLPPDRTAVLIGSQSDPEVCRYGARWRVADWAKDRDADWIQNAQDRIVSVLESAGVVGNMPNIPANRIGSQLDLGGPGFTIAAEEHSGLVALQTAMRMLRAKEIDTALAGAVDLSAEPVHEAALKAMGIAGATGDAAVVLRLKTASAARADGDPIYALLTEGSTDTPSTLQLGDAAGALDLGERLGKAHAARSLLHVAAAVVSVAQGQVPAGHPEVTDPRRALVTSQNLMGGMAQMAVVAADTPVALPPRPPAPERPIRFPAHPKPIVVEFATVHDATMPVAPPLPPTASSAELTVPSWGTHAPTGFEPEFDQMPTAPALPRITAGDAPTPAPSKAPTTPRVPEAPAPLPAPAPPPPIAPPPTEAATQNASPAHLQALADLHRQLSAAHAQFLHQQQEAHGRFLALQQRTTQRLAQAIRMRSSGALPAPLPSPTPAVPAPVAPPVPTKTVVKRPPPPPAPVASTSEVRPGPKFSRAQLERLASEKISEVFGPLFAVQDDFPRQVRMPTPPLLLADRVTGVDAEPGSMTTGVIWTETDVTPDAWYLHDGTMPAGAMIEAGQADLLLISWLGVDFRNRGERVYRLLGCQLTYHGGLPRPGDTLHYEIHIDGHANVGETSIFFFHYDCTDNDGQPRLVVREGQAGFFTDQELAESGGILWTPETGEYNPKARLDPPKIPCTRSSFDEAQVLAFAHGDGFTTFGPGFERLQTHVRSPRIAPSPLNFWTRVPVFDPRGGPWGRGYLRAEQDITPEDWFFDGHFKDDPCMPGTMMFEACLQAVGFYMAALGYTVRHDGWTFEPVPDLPYDLRCRGQVTPEAGLLVYEIFIEEVHDGPWPMVFADFLCTIDGLKAFWARRVGVRLRPDWPLTTRPEVLENYVEPKPVAVVDGFPFDYASLVSCAWGKPSDAFGPLYKPFDEGRHCARLPGDPYHFMSRVTKIDGPIGGMQLGTNIELEYDIPMDAWYFRENGHPTMPFCVLLEAALQPCGWIACFVGSALTTDKDLYFRNLDGTATWHVECLPQSGTLNTKAKITSISQSGGMIIEAFEVQCFLGDTLVYDLKTVFGFFPGAALANQIGLVPTEEERAALHAPSDFFVDLTSRPARYCAGALRLPKPMLLMLDRVTGFWPTGGEKGLGRLRSEKDVNPAEWFFKAHFYTDPVQPGSLGLEAMVQLLQFFMIETDMHAGIERPRFEPLMMGQTHAWKYRGQVVPENQVIRCEVEIIEVGRDDHGPFAKAHAYLWVDDLRIYEGIDFGMRIVDDGLTEHSAPPTETPTATPGPGPEETLSPTGFVGDHRPTWTIPALPAMSMADRLAGAARAVVPGHVVEVRDLAVHGWVKVDVPARIRPVVGSIHPASTHGTEVEVTLETWREARNPSLSRFEAAASGTVRIAPEYPEAPAPWAPLRDAAPMPDPYAAGTLFHGPAYHYLTAWSLGAGGATAHLDPRKGSVPPGTLHQGLLDAVLHAIPHDALHRWSDEIDPGLAGYPLHIESLRLFGPAPISPIRVEARFAGFAERTNVGPIPRILLQAIDTSRGDDGVVWLELTLTEVLLPKGPIGNALPAARQQFLGDRKFVPGVSLSTHDGALSHTDAATVHAADWLPGTVAHLYNTVSDDAAHRLAEVAVKDHVAQRAEVHPSTVRWTEGHAVSTAQPLTSWPIAVERQTSRVTVRGGAPALDIASIESHWDQYFGLGRWPVEDLYYGLIRRFVRRVHLVDPTAHAEVSGRSLLYLGNHQVGVESLLFSMLASGIHGVNTVTVAKAEHRESWLGLLIALCFGYPGASDPRVITFFDRDDKASLPGIIADLASDMTSSGGKSVMVHVEGTRALAARRPVEKMSGAFIDMALHVNAPVVPVRFVGALPVQPLTERLEFPVGMGQMDIWIGRPILPETLQSMTYKDRKELAVQSMNALGPPLSEEWPFPADPAFAAAVDAWVERTGASHEHAVLLKILEENPTPTEASARLLEGVRTGTLQLSSEPVDQWLGLLAERLYGPRGPRVLR